MTLAKLRYFQTACKLGSIALAAQQLHISQPSVSIAIKELEEEFGLALLDRSRRSFSLTAEGTVFLERVDGLLSHAEEFQRSMEELSDSYRTVRLGVPPMIGALIFPRIFADEQLAQERLELAAVEMGGNELFRQLEDRRIDMAFLPHDRPIDSKFRSIPILELETVCCVSRRHHLAGRPHVSIRDLAGEPLVLLFRDGAFNTETILKRFRSEGLLPNILLQTSQLSTVQWLVTQNYAAGFLFRSLADSLPGVEGIPLDPPLPVKVSLVWNKSDYLSNALAGFLKLVRRVKLA